MTYARAIGLGTDTLMLLTVCLAFLLSLRTGRLLPGVLVFWIGLTFQTLVLSEAGAKLAIAQDPLCSAFPEGPAAFALGMIGWLYGLLIAGLGKWIHRMRKKRQNNQQEVIVANAPKPQL